MAFELYNNPGHFTALDLNPEGVNYWYDQNGFKVALKRYRDTAISEILEGTRSRERTLLKLLSVFRKFNVVTLEFLARKIKVEGSQKYLHYFDAVDFPIGHLP